MNNGSFHTEFYIYPKRNILFKCIPINFDFTVHSQLKNLCPKIVYFFIKKIYHKKIDTGKQNRCSTVPAGWNLDLYRCTCNDKKLSANWQVGDTMCQSSYTALSSKISLLSRQRTTKALIRLRGCTGWSAPLLFTYDKNRFCHDVAHFQINMSYLCRIRRKRVCCIQF